MAWHPSALPFLVTHHHSLRRFANAAAPVGQLHLVANKAAFDPFLPFVSAQIPAVLRPRGFNILLIWAGWGMGNFLAELKRRHIYRVATHVVAPIAIS